MSMSPQLPTSPEAATPLAGVAVPAPSRWRRVRLTLGAAGLLAFGIWIGTRLGPLAGLGPGDPLSRGTWLPTPVPPLAYIGGAVVHAGLYPLAANPRVLTLLRQAGGPSRDADLSHLNLAAPVHDGDTLTVPRRHGKGCQTSS